MKTLTSIVNESIERAVLESFGSEKLSAAFKNLNGKYRDVMRSIAWDKLTDEDYEVLSPEDAKKLAYKRDSNEVFVWFTGAPGNEIEPNDKPVCVTNGNYMIRFFNWAASGPFGTGRRGDHHTVKNVAENCEKALHILKPENLMTSELRRARAEAKSNALALKSCYDIARENQERYKKLLAEKSLERDANTATLDARIKEISDEYTAFITEITSLETVTSDAIRAITAVNQNYTAVLDEYKSALFWYRESSNPDAVYAKRMLDKASENLSKMREAINKARAKYVE